MVVNSFILFMDFKDKILVSIFFFTSSYNDVCGKCMHNMHFFYYRLGKPHINLVSLYPLITLLANPTVCNTWSRTRSLTRPHNGEYNYNQNSLTVLSVFCVS